MARFHESLDLFARATLNATWAGEEVSFNWFDNARELTERRHHQEQIRLASGWPRIMTAALYHLVLDCIARGMPYAYRIDGWHCSEVCQFIPALSRFRVLIPSRHLKER